jgi:hypothetical protein
LTARYPAKRWQTLEQITGFTYDPEPFGHLGDGSFIAISPGGNRLYITRYLDGEAAAVSIVPEEL